METKLVITVDTEPDNQWDVRLRRNLRFKNIYGLDKLQKILDKFKARPTYLVTFSVMQSEAIKVLKDIKKSRDCEVGTHLHAWETPPLESPLKGDGTYLHQYAFNTQRQKFTNLDALVSETFRQKPVSYRGGRYSFDKNTIAFLTGSGYLVDTSVTPGISWANDGGPNFKKFLCEDTFFLKDNHTEILEVPVSIAIKTRLPRLAKLLYLHGPNWTHAEGILRRIAHFNLVWLDPSFNTYEDMRWAYELFLEENVRYLNIMFHSSVIIPGTSPYIRSEQESKKFYERLEKLLEYLLLVKKLESLPLREFYDYRKNNH